MSEITYLYEGPWSNEPDHEEFVWAELPCIIQRNSMGTLCGYVGVPPQHPAYKETPQDISSLRKGLIVDGRYKDLDVKVHEGLTWSELGDNKYGRREGFQWFGFDTAHAGDLTPPTNEVWANLILFEVEDAIYRDFEYVRGEVKHLAEQLAAMWQPPSEKEWREQMVFFEPALFKCDVCGEKRQETRLTTTHREGKKVSTGERVSIYVRYCDGEEECISGANFIIQETFR